MAPVIESYNNHNYFRINQAISRQFLNTLQIDQTIKSHVEPCSWSLAPKMYLTFGYLLKINQVQSGFDEAIFVMANIHIFPSDAHCGDPLGVATAQDHPPGRMSPTKWHSVKSWIDLNLFPSVVKHLMASSHRFEPNHCRVSGAGITTVAWLRGLGGKTNFCQLWRIARTPE